MSIHTTVCSFSAARTVSDSTLPPPSAIAGAPERSARSTIGSSRRRNLCSPKAAKNEAIGISS